ncbi:hypothetical protein OsI_21912 [Oryza sativa Indica Group]|uniref:Uncharacterized protein n=4 Tax=Oryza TaxID=4527 RepID=A3B900_ORYSJ|nr:hypothetical protein OsI_21912 [Oryza sativa Indica Group]EAZ36039.1 hypothetical protein OsJ_20346 [Oryza sativa Japonica Group]
MARRDKAFGAHGRDASFGSWWKKCFGAKARAEERARVRAGESVTWRTQPDGLRLPEVAVGSSVFASRGVLLIIIILRVWWLSQPRPFLETWRRGANG